MSLPSPIPYHIYRGQHIDEPHTYDYVVDSAGIVIRAKTPHFYAVQRVAFSNLIRGLCRWPEEGVRLRVSKIPVHWLYRVLEHAQRASGPGTAGRVTALLPVEQMYHFHWLTQDPGPEGWGQSVGWHVSVPKQTATSGRVTYRGGQEATIALDLHSHHEMSAYFSQTDDRDELGARFYAVIGRIFSQPEIRLRLGLYGEFVAVPATTLFESLGPFVDCYTAEGDFE